MPHPSQDIQPEGSIDNAEFAGMKSGRLGCQPTASVRGERAKKPHKKFKRCRVCGAMALSDPCPECQATIEAEEKAAELKRQIDKYLEENP